MVVPITGDLFSSALLAFLAWLIGARMIEGRPRVALWGRCLALCALGLVLVDKALSTGLDGDNRLAAIFEGLLTAWLTLGLSWIALTIMASVFDHAVRKPWTILNRWYGSIRWSRTRCRAQQEEKNRQREALRAYERNAPEREKSRLRDEAEQQSREESQRRRIDARVAALLSFSLFAPKLGDRFTQATFERYVKDFMGDEFTVEVVERRGRELLSILELHLKDIQPPKREVGIESIADWHRRELERIDGLPLEASVKNYCRVSLNRRMQDLLAQHLRDANP